jgi:hypothetical protein
MLGDIGRFTGFSNLERLFIWGCPNITGTILALKAKNISGRVKGIFF